MKRILGFLLLLIPFLGHTQVSQATFDKLVSRVVILEKGTVVIGAKTSPKGDTIFIDKTSDSTTIAKLNEFTLAFKQNIIDQKQLFKNDQDEAAARYKGDTTLQKGLDWNNGALRGVGYRYDTLKRKVDTLPTNTALNVVIQAIDLTNKAIETVAGELQLTKEQVVGIKKILFDIKDAIK